jgi:hypothetical protein
MDENSDHPIRHLVMCRFPQGTTPAEIHAFIDHFRAITRLIPGVLSFEWGANNSPEGLERGLTHTVLITFKNAQARDEYLPHPEHQRFVAEKGSLMAEVLVFDYTPQA